MHSTNLSGSVEAKYRVSWFCLDINPPTPKSDQFQISPAASPEILSHSMKKLAFQNLPRRKMIMPPYPHYLIYTLIFRKVGRMYFLNLGVKGLNEREDEL